MKRAFLTLIFTGTFVASPLFTEPFTGFRADQLPIAQIDPPIQPEGYAFAIWGLIYGWLVVSAAFGIWKRQTDPAWEHMRAPLIVSLALGTPWLWVANQWAIAATVLIFAMAVFAIIALFRAPVTDTWWARMPVSLYAGWLTAASFVALGTTMAGYGIFFGSTGWAFMGILMALLVAISVQEIAKSAPGYGAAVIWALVGVIVANGVSGSVGWIAAVGIATLTFAVIRQERA
ncbi:MAG: hypothetical protein ACSHWY_07430 [Octadecabacter sp.]